MVARGILIARLRARKSEIEQAIFTRIQGDWFDRTGAGDPEYVAGLRAAGVAGLEYVFAGIESWGRSLAPAPEEALVQAERAARAGVGLDTVLRRYVAGHAVVQDFIVCEVERGELAIEAGGLRGVLRAVGVLADRLIGAVSDAYGREVGRAKAPSVRALAPSGRRERIVTAMVEVVAERGFAHTTVRLVSARARVSTRTFYEEFEGLRECFIAGLDIGSQPDSVGNPPPRAARGGRRGRECLLYLADHPGSSNSQIAAAIGVAHRSQISRLLSALDQEGLVVKLAEERTGMRNQWSLTSAGEKVVCSLGSESSD